MAVSQYFLGANTPGGFHSLYSGLIDRDSTRAVYILKGGPGCGKSSFMRRVGRRAEEAGLSAEYILCSGDPDSLDGLVLPELGVALADGTAPHVIEPSCPGAVDHYLDLGQFYDKEALAPHREAILSAMADNRDAYGRCYRCLAAAGTLGEDIRALLITGEVRAKLARRAKGIVGRELKREGVQRGKMTMRFLSGLTCRGAVTLWDTVAANYPKVYELRDSFDLAHHLLEPIGRAAAERGYDTVACPSPMAPGRLLHLLIPALGLAFVTSAGEDSCPVRPFRRLRLDAMVTAGEENALHRARAKFSAKVASALAAEALGALAQAKEAHDRLEAIYNPHVDFLGVYSLADDLAETILEGTQPVTASP